MKENSIEDIIKKKYTKYSHCETDIIGLTLEEAIFILETEERRSYVISIVQEACKVILSDCKRVLKENEELNDKYAAFVKMSSEVIANSIPIQRIKDKIKEYKEKSNELYTEFLKSDTYDIDLRERWTKCDAIVQVLQELIEGRE